MVCGWICRNCHIYELLSFTAVSWCFKLNTLTIIYTQTPRYHCSEKSLKSLMISDTSQHCWSFTDSHCLFYTTHKHSLTQHSLTLLLSNTATPHQGTDATAVCSDTVLTTSDSLLLPLLPWWVAWGSPRDERVSGRDATQNTLDLKYISTVEEILWTLLLTIWPTFRKEYNGVTHRNLGSLDLCQWIRHCKSTVGKNRE
jgi:hypothetical protein